MKSISAGLARHAALRRFAVMLSLDPWADILKNPAVRQRQCTADRLFWGTNADPIDGEFPRGVLCTVLRNARARLLCAARRGGRADDLGRARRCGAETD